MSLLGPAGPSTLCNAAAWLASFVCLLQLVVRTQQHSMRSDAGRAHKGVIEALQGVQLWHVQLKERPLRLLLNCRGTAGSCNSQQCKRGAAAGRSWQVHVRAGCCCWQSTVSRALSGWFVSLSPLFFSCFDVAFVVVCSVTASALWCCFACQLLRMHLPQQGAAIGLSPGFLWTGVTCR